MTKTQLRKESGINTGALAKGVFIMMIRTVTLDRDQKPTKEQIRQIEDAAKNRNTQKKMNIS